MVSAQLFPSLSGAILGLLILVTLTWNAPMEAIAVLMAAEGNAWIPIKILLEHKVRDWQFTYTFSPKLLDIYE